MYRPMDLLSLPRRQKEYATDSNHFAVDRTAKTVPVTRVRVRHPQCIQSIQKPIFSVMYNETQEVYSSRQPIR